MLLKVSRIEGVPPIALPRATDCAATPALQPGTVVQVAGHGPSHFKPGDPDSEFTITF